MNGLGYQIAFFDSLILRIAQAGFTAAAIYCDGKSIWKIF
jgi:hypothetical protein